MPTVKVIIWSYSRTAKGHPIRLRISAGQTERYYPILVQNEPLYLSISQFSKTFEKPKSTLCKIFTQARENAIKALPSPFTWDSFEANYRSQSPKPFYYYCNRYLESLKDRPGSYLSYSNAFSKWRAFKTSVEPLEVLSLLPDFEKTIPGKSTRGFYLRATRAAYNDMRKELKYLPEWNYTIKSKVGTHKGYALSIDQLKAFMSAKVTSAQERARRLWLISFYFGGMNVTDILEIRHEDLKGDRLTYSRAKTINSKDSSIELTVPEELKEIVGIGLGYIIPDFKRSANEDALTKKRRINNFIGNINTRLKKIAKAQELPPITTYCARHTFASLLKSNGTPIELIREMLGHSDIRTTESYLTRFDFERKKAAAEKVFNLKAS